MLKGMIRAATLLAGLATAMTAMTAAAQTKGHGSSRNADPDTNGRFRSIPANRRQATGSRAAWRQICKLTMWWWREEAPLSMAFLRRRHPPEK